MNKVVDTDGSAEHASPSASTVKQFCERLSIGRTKAHQLIADGTVKSFKLGRRRLIVNSSIDALFDATA